jgi:hypothetical protein
LRVPRHRARPVRAAATHPPGGLATTAVVDSERDAVSGAPLEIVALVALAVLVVALVVLFGDNGLAWESSTWKSLVSPIPPWLLAGATIVPFFVWKRMAT